MKNNFRKNILIMMGGVALAKVIPFLSLPFLYRIYEEEDFGSLYLFSSLTILLAGLGTLSYEFAIVMERKLRDSFNLTLTVFFILGAFCILLFPFFYFFGDYLSLHTSLVVIKPYLWLVPFSVFFLGGVNILNYWLNRASLFHFISAGRIINGGGGESVKLFAGYKSFPGGLIIGFLVGIFLMFLWYLNFFLRVFKKLYSRYSFKSAFTLLKKHKKFPRFSLPSGLITNTVNFLYISLFIRFFGTDVAGNLGLAVTYLYGAFSMVSVAYSQVFYNEIAPITDKAKLKSFYWKNSRFLAIIALIIIVMMFLIPSDVIIWVLGSKAVNLIPILKIVIFWMAISFVVSSLSFIYAKINAQDKMFYLDLFRLFSVPGSIFLSYQLEWGVEGALWAFTAAQAFHYILALVLVNYFIKLWKP